MQLSAEGGSKACAVNDEADEEQSSTSNDHKKALKGQDGTNNNKSSEDYDVSINTISNITTLASETHFFIY